MENGCQLADRLGGIALLVVGLIAYARGPEHHRGDEVGTHGTKVVVVVPG